MRSRGRGAIAQVVVAALLLLVISPATAPFLTFDARSLDGLPVDAVVQAKKAHDEPAPACGGAPLLPFPLVSVGECPVPPGGTEARRPLHPVPLRI